MSSVGTLGFVGTKAQLGMLGVARYAVFGINSSAEDCLCTQLL
jgi:hypothetical protein